MAFLPILHRELRVRARSRAHYWARFGVALTALFLTLPSLLWSSNFATPATVGRGLFDGIIAAAFLLSCSACLLTADAISAEARAGTLDLLLLTRVRTFDVLTGKFASTALAAIFALVAFSPVLSLPLLAGGVTGGEAVRKGLSLLATLFLALSVGLWASTRRRERFQTGRLAVVVLLVLLLVPGLLALCWPTSGFQLAGPLGSLSAAADLAYKKSAGRFWLSLCLVVSLGCVLLLAAVFALRRGSPLRQSPESSAQPVFVTAPSVAIASGTCSGGACGPYRRQSVGSMPLHWLLARQRGLKLLFWLAAFVSLLQIGLYWPFIRFLPLRSTPLWSWSMSVVGGGITGALFAWGASRFFIEARRSGELELLLTTPLGAQELLFAHWAVLKRWMVWPVVVMVLPTLVQALAYLAFGWFSSPAYWQLSYGASSLIGVVNLILGSGAVSWLGMWFGLRAGGQGQAILWPVGLARALPFVFNFLCSLLWRVVFGSLSLPRSSHAFVAILGPQVLTLILFLLLVSLARHQSCRELSGGEPLSVPQLLASSLASTAGLFRQARHWTPR